MENVVRLKTKLSFRTRFHGVVHKVFAVFYNLIINIYKTNRIQHINHNRALLFTATELLVVETIPSFRRFDLRLSLN